MASELTHAETARLAHQALRLRENGIDTEAKLRKASNATSANGDQQRVAVGRADALAGIAQTVLNTTDPEHTATPTSPEAVSKIMSLPSLDDIWRTWDEAVTANLEATLSDSALKAWRASVEKDQKRFEETQAKMTGQAPAELVEELEAMIAGSNLDDEQADQLRARVAANPAGPHEWNVHPYFGHLRHVDGAANALYDLGREGFLTGAIDWDTAVFKVALVDSAVYTVNLATHQFMSSVASVVATSPAIATKTSTAGVADGDDSVFSTVSGAQSEALIIYQSSAVTGGGDVAAASQRLTAYIDTATGLPVTPNGGNITVAWDSGSNRIFKL